MAIVTVSADEAGQVPGHQLAELVEHALAVAGHGNLEVEIRSEFQHDGWDWAQPCPECGSDELSISGPATEIVEVDGQGGIYNIIEDDSTIKFQDSIEVRCSDPSCMEFLYRHPASRILP